MSRKAFIRQEAIVDYLMKEGELTVDDLCSKFDVSEATIRRDLSELEDLARIKRVSGGARAIPSSEPEPPIFSRMTEVSREKELIGKAAAELIEDGNTVFISSGTTAFQVARNLVHKKNITIITNSLPVIDLVSKVPGIVLITLGGILRHSEQSFVGPGAEAALLGLRADKVILGVRAIHAEHGLTNDALPETQVDRLVIGIASEVVVVADHTKFQKIAPLYLAPLSSVSKIITDRISYELTQIYTDKDIEIIQSLA